jgi:ribosomal protein L32
MVEKQSYFSWQIYIFDRIDLFSLLKSKEVLTMGLMYCPECGTKISEKATVCPYCGFTSDYQSISISEIDSYEIVPRFTYDIENWIPEIGELKYLSYEDNRNLVQYFSKWENIKMALPAIAEMIENMIQTDTVMVAKIDKHIMDLIKKGTYRFTIDKTGEILPTIRDAQGIVKQVRLENRLLPPNINQSLNNLAVHIVMSQILDEIENVKNAISNIHIELQNDRLSMAESSRDKLLQAMRIKDTRLREFAIINVINGATDAKRILMRNFSNNNQFIIRNANKTYPLLIAEKNKDESKKKAKDALQALVYIANAVQIESKGYAILGEYEASKECLAQFRDFIFENKLHKRDTLLRINENLKDKQIETVNTFSEIALKISSFDKSFGIEENSKSMIKGGGYDEEI